MSSFGPLENELDVRLLAGVDSTLRSRSPQSNMVQASHHPFEGLES